MIGAVRHAMHFVGMRLLHTGVLQCRVGTWLAKRSGLLSLPVGLQPPCPPSRPTLVRLQAPSEPLPDTEPGRTLGEMRAIRDAMHDRLHDMGAIIHDLGQVQLTLENLSDRRRVLGDQLDTELARRISAR